MPNRRKLLYGRKATEKEIVDEICRLVTGDESRNVPPLTMREIAVQLGFDQKTVYRYARKGMDKYGVISRDKKNGRIQKAKQTQQQLQFRRFDKYHHTILSDPLVSEWRQDLLTRNGGVPIQSWRTRILALEHVCNICSVPPRELIINTKHTEKIMKNFAEKLGEGKVSYRTKQHKKLQDLDLRTSVYYRVMAVRDFCGYYGITWKRGINNIMSGKVPSHGKYSDIRLTTEQIEQADQFIKQQWGLDSDIYRWFFVGLESCCRFSSLYNMELDYVIHKNNYSITYTMTAYESKTAHIKNGKWTKYVTRSDTQESLDLLKQRNTSRRIYESDSPKYRFVSEINRKLKQIYFSLGIKNNYFYSHPIHALRHIGAHYWLEKTNYNYGLVAMIGGWHTIDELKKSYGEIPPERVLAMIQKTSD